MNAIDQEVLQEFLETKFLQPWIFLLLTWYFKKYAVLSFLTYAPLMPGDSQPSEISVPFLPLKLGQKCVAMMQWKASFINQSNTRITSHNFPTWTLYAACQGFLVQSFHDPLYQINWFLFSLHLIAKICNSSKSNEKFSLGY